MEQQKNSKLTPLRMNSRKGFRLLRREKRPQNTYQIRKHYEKKGAEEKEEVC